MAGCITRGLSASRTVLATLALAGLLGPGALQAWQSEGPNSITGGQVTRLPGNDPVSGAIQELLVNPTPGAGGAITAYAGSVNGGVWRTSNLLAANVVWTPLTDSLPSLSVGALTFDQADPTNQTIVYGAGLYSNYGVSGPLEGLFRSTNGGNAWTQLGAATFSGASISSAIVNGSSYAVSVASQNGSASGGIFLSNNGGASFSQIVGGSTGLTNAPVATLVADPNTPGRLYAGVIGRGVLVSNNGGATWTATTLPNVTIIGGTTVNPNTDNDNFKIVAQNYGGSTVLYAGVDTNGQASGFFRSTNGGSTWQSMQIPTTIESGVTEGLNPGSQGTVNFSLIADPTNPNLIYVGGDLQPAPDPNNQNSYPSPSTPNSSGAINYTARLFSGSFDSGNSTTTWTPITDNYARVNQSAPSGTGGTAPHADSRAFAFAPDGSMIESNDGGIFLRNNPTQNTGTWTSLNGNLAVTEVIRVAYDANSHTLISGNQDVGATMQASPGGGPWTEFIQGDGGDVAVDTLTRAAQGEAIRYTQNYQFSSLSRTTFNAANQQMGAPVYLGLNVTTVLGGGIPLHDNLTNYSSSFYPRIQLNSVNPSQIAFGGVRYLFTSPDKGDTLTQLNSIAYGSEIVDLAYGGVLNGVSNANVLWAVDNKQILYGANTTLQAPAELATIGSLPVNTPLTSGEDFAALALNPTNYYEIAIAGAMHVWLTTNASTFSDITGNLFTLGLQQITTIAYLAGTPAGDALLVGGSGGMFASLLGSPGDWFDIGSLGGSPIPNAYINELLYAPEVDTIYAATLGRGVWSLQNASSLIAAVPEPKAWELLAFGLAAIGSITAAPSARRKSGGN